MTETDPSTLVATLRLTLNHDSDAECPNEWGGWRLISFGRRHTAHEDPDRYCAGLDKAGDPIPATIGLRRKLTTGTAFWLGCFEHGLCRWSLMGEGNRCPWDSVRIAGILLWDAATRDLPRGHEARKANARSFLEAYTAWANGEVYSFHVEDETGNTIDGCGGFYDPVTLFDTIGQAVQGRPVEIAGEARWLTDFYEIAA